MAGYTMLGAEALAAIIAQFDVGPLVSAKGIAEGVSNSNWLLETGAGRFILTVYEHRVAEDDLPFFLGLMRWVHDHGFPSATPVPGRDGEALRRIGGKPAVIVTFLSGMSVSRPTAAHCLEAVACGGARLWLATGERPGPRPLAEHVRTDRRRGR
jgi:homoserine kinase type II